MKPFTLIVILLVLLYFGREEIGANLGMVKVIGRSKANAVHPELQLALDEWNGPFPIKVTSGLRTDAEQRALYAIGRTTQLDSPIVTYAQTAADTAHGRGAAIDVVPAPNGLADYSDAAKFGVLSSYMKARGFVWGGDWRKLVDKPHYEMQKWKILAYPVPDYASMYQKGISA